MHELLFISTSPKSSNMHLLGMFQRSAMHLAFSMELQYLFMPMHHKQPMYEPPNLEHHHLPMRLLPPAAMPIKSSMGLQCVQVRQSMRYFANLHFTLCVELDCLQLCLFRAKTPTQCPRFDLTKWRRNYCYWNQRGLGQLKMIQYILIINSIALLEY